MMTTEEMVMYDQLVEMGIATAEEINLAYNVADKGWTELLHRILFARTGYRSIEQMTEAEDEEEEETSKGLTEEEIKNAGEIIGEALRNYLIQMVEEL